MSYNTESWKQKYDKITPDTTDLYLDTGMLSINYQILKT